MCPISPTPSSPLVRVLASKANRRQLAQWLRVCAAQQVRQPVGVRVACCERVLPLFQLPLQGAFLALALLLLPRDGALPLELVFP